MLLKVSRCPPHKASFEKSHKGVPLLLCFLVNRDEHFSTEYVDEGEHFLPKYVNRDIHFLAAKIEINIETNK